MVHRECKNCGRVKGIVREGLCFTCNKAASGKNGKEREVALANVKAKIESGEIKTRDVSRKKDETAEAAKNFAGLLAVANAEVKPAKTLPAPGGGPIEANPKVLGNIDHPESKNTKARLITYPLYPDSGEPIPGQLPTEIPIVIRLMMEISVRVAPIAG